MMNNAPFSDLRCEHRAEPVPPKTHRLVADIDTVLEQQVLDLAQRAVVDYAVEYPAYGQVRVSNELRKLGVFVSASGVRSIWMRHDLANFKQRLKALEVKVANGSITTTMNALNRAKSVKGERRCRPWRTANKSGRKNS